MGKIKIKGKRTGKYSKHQYDKKIQLITKKKHPKI
jgi:hypothetical protein